MIESLSAKDLAVFLRAKLDEGDTVIAPLGKSMLPTVRETDLVLLSRRENLRKNDIVVYVRQGGKAVLHRIVGFDERGCIMSGDAQYVKEFGITPKDVLAVVTEIHRGDKTIRTDSVLFKIRSWFIVKTKILKRIRAKIRRSI